MDFALSPRAEETCARMWDFMREEVFPAERDLVGSGERTPA